MMVAGNRGFMPVETRNQAGRTGSAIRRIPLAGQDGQLKSEYYCYWPRDRANRLIEEFADILAGMFEGDVEEYVRACGSHADPTGKAEGLRSPFWTSRTLPVDGREVRRHVSADFLCLYYAK